MKRAFVLFQWLVLAGVIGGFAHSMFKPVPPPVRAPESWRSWDGFMAVSYRGIIRNGDDPDAVSPARFAEHMEALEQAGYRTITPEDADDFLNGRSPLPEKALLILFEGGRKDSSIYGTPELRKHGACATMFIPTRLAELRGDFFLSESDIEALLKDPHWNIGSMGHAAVDLVPVDGEGVVGHFLGRRLQAAEGPESDSAFRKRIAMDYARASRILVGLSGNRITAYLHPYADSGRGREADPEAAEINRDEVARFHRMAFSRDGNPFNGADSDPFDLTRQRVSGRWDGKRLVRELEDRVPCPFDLPVEGIRNGAPWRFSEDAFLEDGDLILPAGASARTETGSDWPDLELTTRLSLEAASAARIYVRWTGPRSYLCLTLDETGVSFQERLPRSMETLLRLWRPVETGRDHFVGLRVKGRRAWISLNGEPLREAIPLRRSDVAGSTVIEADGGMVRVSDFHAIPLPNVVVFAERLPQVTPDLRDSTSSVMPTWFHQPLPRSIDATEVVNARRLADAGVRIIPVVNSPEELGETDARTLRDRIDDMLRGEGLRPLIDAVATRGPNMNLPAAFLERGYSVVVVLTPEEVDRLPGALPSSERCRLLIAGDEEGTRIALDHALRRVPPRRLLATLPPAALPIGAAPVIRGSNSAADAFHREREPGADAPCHAQGLPAGSLATSEHPTPDNYQEPQRSTTSPASSERTP